MKSRYLLNLFLIVVVVGLYWLLNQKPSPPQQITVTQMAQQDITDITITRPGLDEIILQKNSSNWQLIHPIQAPANNTRVKLLLSILNTASYAQLPRADNATLKPLGFDQASTTLTLNNASFRFGKTEAISHRRYLLHNKSVHLVDDNVAPLLNASAASFIDNKLIPVGRQISKLSVPTLNQQNVLSTKAIMIEQKNGHWHSENKTISNDQLSLVIDAWQSTHALQVLPLNKARLPASEPQLVTVWYHQQTSPTKFDLQRDDKTLYLNNRSLKLSYQFPISLIQQLVPKP